MTEKELYILLENLVNEPKENEWIEFKLNFHSEEEIGQNISALSNGACLFNQEYGYLVFGVNDTNHTVEGTDFCFSTHKKSNEEIENWLIQRLNPRIDFKVFELYYNSKHILIIEIPAANIQPVRFLHVAYIRVGSYTRKLIEFPEKERKIWERLQEKTFEKGTALPNIEDSDVIQLLDTQSFFELIDQPYPTNQQAVIKKLESEKFIKTSANGINITNLGAILFAKNINDFPTLSRKAVRVIVYQGTNRINTEREQSGVKGYASGYEGLINWINGQLPANEEIGRTFRKDVRIFPEIAIRELVANTIIHQDFSISGTGPIIEIFTDRIVFTNPGLPLITTNRFIDEFQSRNEDIAAFMRRIGICEEKGSGIDKVIDSVEFFQLPAPDFEAMEKHTKVKLFSYKDLNQMDKNDKIRACYQHACLRYVSNEKMTNQSLRERFKIEEKNAAIASRIIRDTIDAEFIKEDDPESKSRKFAKYIPFWA